MANCAYAKDAKLCFKNYIFSNNIFFFFWNEYHFVDFYSVKWRSFLNFPGALARLTVPLPPQAAVEIIICSVSLRKKKTLTSSSPFLNKFIVMVANSCHVEAEQNKHFNLLPTIFLDINCTQIVLSKKKLTSIYARVCVRVRTRTRIHVYLCKGRNNKKWKTGAKVFGRRTRRRSGDGHRPNDSPRSMYIRYRFWTARAMIFARWYVLLLHVSLHAMIYDRKSERSYSKRVSIANIKLTRNVPRRAVHAYNPKR